MSRNPSPSARTLPTDKSSIGKTPSGRPSFGLEISRGQIALDRLHQGDEQAYTEFFLENREQMLGFIRSRLAISLATRIDAEDVLQEAFMDGRQRLQHLQKARFTSFVVWFRMIVNQTLANCSRRHLAAGKRSIARETRAGSKAGTGIGMPSMDRFTSPITSPSKCFSRQEDGEKIELALRKLSASDREIIQLRHFDEMANAKIAERLRITPKAASIRYFRALARLKHFLQDVSCSN